MDAKDTSLDEYPITYLGYLLGCLSVILDDIIFFLHGCICRTLGLVLPSIFEYSRSCPATPTCPSVVLITGASSGIGRDVAMALAKRGYTVVAGVRKSKDGAALEGAFYDWKSHSSTKTNGKLFPVILDVSNSIDMENAAQTVYRYCSSNNVPFVALINNAGVAIHGPLELLSMKAMRRQYDTNFFGMLELAKKMLPLLRSKATDGAGRIINLGSMAGRNTIMPQLGIYSSSKAAIRLMTQTLQLELYGLGIHVSLIEPGAVASRAVTSLKSDPTLSGKFTGPDYEQVNILVEGNKYTQEQVIEHYVHQGNIGNSYNVGASAEPSWVVSKQVIHAIESNYPLIDYQSGLDAKVGTFGMRILGPNFIKAMMKLMPNADKKFSVQGESVKKTK